MFKRAIVGFALTCMLTGCGGGGGDCVEERHPTIHEKIINWQARERLVQENDIEFVGGYTKYVKMQGVVWDIVHAYSVPKYKAEKVDYWKTSRETAIDMTGDCEDIAAYWYRIMRDAQVVSDHNLFIRIVSLPSGAKHAILVLTLEGKELIVDGQTLWSYIKDAETIIEYDLWSIFG